MWDLYSHNPNGRSKDIEIPPQTIFWSTDFRNDGFGLRLVCVDPLVLTGVGGVWII